MTATIVQHSERVKSTVIGEIATGIVWEILLLDIAFAIIVLSCKRNSEVRDVTSYYSEEWSSYESKNQRDESINSSRERYNNH